MEPLSSSEHDATSDIEDIVIMDETHEIVKHFLKEALIVWYDTNSSCGNSQLIEQLKTISDVKIFTGLKDAASYLKGNQLPSCQIIISGSHGEPLVKEISRKKKILSIHIFDDNKTGLNGWTKNYPKIVSIDNDFKDLFVKVREARMSWQKQRSSLRNDLPAFAPIFDDIDKSENHYLHYYLKGFVNFENRKQAKRDFLTLAKLLFEKKIDIDDINAFEKDYNAYSMKQILNWYTRESFFYTVVNNSFRIATSDSILSCRLPLRDLEVAIKEEYHQKSKNFNGILYRGGYMSDQDWTKLQQNINKEIEMYGFLSTTEDIDVAISRCQLDYAKKALVTVIVPRGFAEDEQGFAKLEDYSVFATEKEILFNVRSRFTILETSVEQIQGLQLRHLVLLYGAQAMRRYMKINDPKIEINLNNINNLKCQVCHSQIQIPKESGIFVNLSNSNELCCKDCVQKYQPHDKSALLYLSPSSQSLSQKVQGFVVQYQENLKTPMYGYRCRNVNKRDLNVTTSV